MTSECPTPPCAEVDAGSRADGGAREDDAGESPPGDAAVATDAGPQPDETCATDPVDGVVSDDGTPSIEPTFHSAGLYWKPAAGAADVACHVEVRRRGECTWRGAQDLWFDPNDHASNGGPAERTHEYRGSLLDLVPGVAYEVRLTLEDGTRASLPFTTWSEDFPIARTVVVDATRDATLVIDEGGSAETGYVLYVAADGGSTIDVGTREENGVEVDASWVIVRGLTVRGGTANGIRLGAVDHVVIEACDVSGWGSVVTSGRLAGFGKNLQAAVYSSEPSLSHVVVQRNHLHHPRTDANSWDEFGASDHPEGPQGVVFRDSSGHHVVRYNRIESDDEHRFNDGMGEVHNFSYTGFPGRDSDIYGNHVTDCWDDAIETEGANMNVRVFGNYTDRTFIAHGAAGQSVGPFYLFRNVSGRSNRGAPEHGTEDREGSFVKIGSSPALSAFARGRMYIFHNTSTIQPAYFRSGMSSTRGIRYAASDKHQDDIVTRNNLMLSVDPSFPTVYDPSLNPTNDFDYDLTNSRFAVASDQESNGTIGATVSFASEGDLGWPLASGSPGFDDALVLPGFNVGAAPDRGAFEAGAPVTGYGMSADWTPWSSWVWSH